MDDPDPSLKPVTLPELEAVHENVIPGTFPTRLMLTLLPEQVLGAAGTMDSTCSGVTVTVTVTGLPVQPLLVGVMTYLTS